MVLFVHQYLLIYLDGCSLNKIYIYDSFLA